MSKMIAKAFLFVCVQAVIIQSISANCCGSRTVVVPSCGCSDIDNYYGYSKSSGSTGGPLTVTCYGPLSSTGLSVLAEIGMKGEVDVNGCLPFLSAVALDGIVPTNGQASVDYGCGNGNIVIVQETGNPNGNNAACNSGLSIANLGRCGCSQCCNY